MSELKEFDGSLIGIYIKNLENIEGRTRNMIMAKSANKLMKSFILAHPCTYFKQYFLRQHPEPSFEGQYYHLDPFILYYFDNWDSLKTHMNSPNVRKCFQGSKDEKSFYTFLTEQVLELAEATKNEKFLIKRGSTIELVEKFVIHTIRKRGKG